MSLSAAAPVASLDAVVAAASDAAAPAAAATNTVTGADGPVKKARLPCSRVAPTCLTCGVVGHRTDLCIAHLHPHVILHVTPAKKHRFATHLQALAAEAERAKQQAELSGEAVEWMPGDRLIVVDSAKEPELLFLRTPHPARLVAWIQHSTQFHRHYCSIYTVQWWAKTLEEVADKLLQLSQTPIADATDFAHRETDAAGLSKILPASLYAPAAAAASSAPAAADGESAPAPSCTFRVQTHPKSVRASLLATVSQQVLHPHSFSHVLFVVHAYNKFYVSIESRDLFHLPHGSFEQAVPKGTLHVPDAAADVLSRAYFKLQETFLMDHTLRSRIGKGVYAVDIGASPGGWSDYLATVHGCPVLAIDPGVVSCRSPLVRHVPKLLQESFGDVRAFAAEAAEAGRGGLGLLVCDMNVRPLEAASLIRTLCEAAPLAPDAALILTCKETQAGRSKALVTEAVAELSDWWTDFRSLHLLSNGKERTLIAHVLQASPERRAELRAERAAVAAEAKRAWEQKVLTTPSPAERNKEKMERKAKSKAAKNQAAAGDAAAPSSSPQLQADAVAAAAAEPAVA